MIKLFHVNPTMFFSKKNISVYSSRIQIKNKVPQAFAFEGYKLD